MTRDEKKANDKWLLDTHCALMVKVEDLCVEILRLRMKIDKLEERLGVQHFGAAATDKEQERVFGCPK